MKPSQNIKCLLLATRAEDTPESFDLPELARALQAAQYDPDLAAWLKKEHEIDAAISAKLKQCAVPSNLKETIMAAYHEQETQSKTIPFPFTKIRPYLIAAAAALIIGVFLWSPWQNNTHLGPATSLASYMEELVAFSESDFQLATLAEDPTQLETWLQNQPLCTDYRLPRAIDKTVRTYGSCTPRMGGKQVGVICYQVPGIVGAAHLFIIGCQKIADPKPTSTPVFAQHNGWAYAAWREDTLVYVLIGKGEPQSLRAIFSQP